MRASAWECRHRSLLIGAIFVSASAFSGRGHSSVASWLAVGLAFRLFVSRRSACRGGAGPA